MLRITIGYPTASKIDVRLLCQDSYRDDERNPCESEAGDTMQPDRYRRPPLIWTLLFLVTPLTAAFVGCNAAARTVTRQARPLAYVGQVQLGMPKNKSGRIVVPLKYVGGNWTQNSALVPVDVDSTVKNKEIEITIFTAVATGNAGDTGRELVLPEGSEGQYAVYYRDPDGSRHRIGEVQIQESHPH